MKHDGYQHLRAERIIETLAKLQARVRDRFPEAGLSRVCAELVETARFCAQDAAQLARPGIVWRMLALTLGVAGLAAQVAAFRYLHVDASGLAAPDLVQALESAVNLLILFGGAVWFVLTLEERSKRRRALDALHRLRAVAHVIDMHQLTKDPTTLLDPQPTSASPPRSMTQFELTRYLDYCAEMLSLIGKLAALYADRMRDAVVIDAVNDIEDLTTGLGRKIWQKITIIGALQERRR